MRISELAVASGASVPTIKFYLREGLLAPGRATAATQAEYDDAHLHRIRLIQSLTEVAGLPVRRAKEILALVDRPGDDLYQTLGAAVAQLPPYLRDEQATAPDHPRARAALEHLGQVYDPDFPAVAQLERALGAVEAAGMPMTSARLETYGTHLAAIAHEEVSLMPDDADSAVEYAVVGTALYEPVLLALRRLAHQDLAARRLGAVSE